MQCGTWLKSNFGLPYNHKKPNFDTLYYPVKLALPLWTTLYIKATKLY